MTENPTNRSEKAAPTKRRGSWFRRLLISFVFLLVLIGGGAFFLLGTEKGLHTLLWVGDRLAPGIVKVGAAEGALWGSLRLKAVNLELPTAKVSIEALELDWLPRKLLDRELRVTALTGQGIHLGLIESTDDKPSEPIDLGLFSKVELPLSVFLDRMAVSDLVIQAGPEAEPLEISSAQLGLELKGREILAKGISMEMAQPTLALTAEAKAILETDLPISLDADWQMADLSSVTGDFNAVSLEGKVSLDGDLTKLNLVHETDGAIRSRMDAEVEDPLGQAKWQGSLSLTEFLPKGLQAALPSSSIDIQLAARGTTSALTFDGDIKASIEDVPEAGRLKASLSAGLEDGGLQLSSLKVTSDRLAATLNAEGHYQLIGDDAGQFSFSTGWQDLQWPLEQAQYTSPRGKLEAHGKFADFRHTLGLDFQGDGIPPVALSAHGTGTPEVLVFEELVAELLDGTLSGGGQVSWAPELDWTFDLEASNLNPERQWPEVKGSLNARLETKGIFADAMDATVDLHELQGELQQRPLAGSASLLLRDETLEIQNLNLQAGANKVELSGLLGTKLSLAAVVDAPEMNILVPGVRGALTLDAKVEGEIQRPEIDGTFTAKELGYSDLSLSSAQGRVRVGADQQSPLAITLEVNGLKSGGFTLDKTRINTSGTANQHEISIEAEGPDLNIVSRGSASLAADNRYSGRIGRLELTSPTAGSWSLAEAVEFDVAEENWSLGRACLNDSKGLGNACVKANGGGSRTWALELNAPRLDLALIKPFLPDDMVLEGEVRADGQLEANANRLVGEMKIEVPSGSSAVEFGEADQVLDFSGTSVALKASGGNLDANLGLPLKGLGRLDGKLALPGFRLDAPARADQKVSFSLQGGLTDLSSMAAVAPQLTNVAGSLDVDVKVSGTLGAPKPNGGLRIRDGAFEVPAAGIQVRELNFTAANRSLDSLDFDGSAKVGDGVLQLDGETRLTNDRGLATRIEIKGNRIRIADVPEATIIVTPDIFFSVDRTRAELGGRVDIPEARLRPRGLPEGSVAPSSDIVVKGDSAVDDELQLATAADVRIVLGDKVSFDGFGLRGLFRGNLRVTQEPGKLALGNGQISVANGRFVTFGEELDIEQGRLLFANTPVSNPGINIVAQRRVSDATVGVRASGTLKKPKVVFFSDPPMGQAEALNYLLTGGSSRGGGASVVGGNLLVKEAGRRIGLDDVGVTQGKNSNNLAFYLGTYLTPKLYMQYISDVGEKANRVRIRYDLTNRIQVEAETGDVQAADIYYNFER